MGLLDNASVGASKGIAGAVLLAMFGIFIAMYAQQN